MLAFLLLAASVQVLWNPLHAQQVFSAETYGGDIGVQHSECSFFTDAREKLLDSSLEGDRIAAARRSVLTSSGLSGHVVSASPKMSANFLPQRSRAASSRNLEARGIIDENIFGTLQAAAVTPAPASTDAEFLRRVSLDLTGRIPTGSEVVAFLADMSPDKRGSAIERLLNTPQWADRWTMFFGDLFRNTTATAQVNRYPDGRDAFHIYLRDSLLENKPYDQMAREILVASGSNDGRYYPADFDSYEGFLAYVANYESNPVTATPASYLVGALTRGGPVHDTFDAAAFNLARDFLGVSQMDCILCHDGDGHLDTLSVWGGQAKRSEAWGLAAFFADTLLVRPRRPPPPPDGGIGMQPRWWNVVNRADLPVDTPELRRFPADYVVDTTTGNRPERQPEDNNGEPVAAPVYPFGGGGPKAGESRREALGRLLTADIQFSRAIVNYVWREFFSRGIVEPADQFDLGRLDPANPPPDPWQIQPSHPYLLQGLAEGFVNNGFDLKWLMSEIANSRAYQLSSRYDGEWSAAYEPLFARYQAKRLGAEQIHDALIISSGVFEPYVLSRSIGPVVFAMQFPDVQDLPRAPRRPTNDGALAAAAVTWLDAFLRGDREETPRSAEATIIQALHLMNSPLVLERVKASRSAGALAALLLEPDPVVVSGLHLLVLSRYPAPEELTAGLQLLQTGNRSDAAEDLMWSLYNKVDFIFNY